MRQKKWKLIIFDMDGTLYDLDDTIQLNYMMQLDFYSQYTGYTTDCVKRIFWNNDIFPYVSNKSKSATEFFSHDHVCLAQWKKYRNKHFDVSWINPDKAASDDSIKRFHSEYKTVLLTSNSLDNVYKVLERINISINNFDVVVCCDYNYPFDVFDKGRAIQHISHLFSINIYDMLSIGDRYHTDIEPMLNLGGAGIVVKIPTILDKIYYDLKQGNLEETNYTFFHQRNYCDEKSNEYNEII